MRKNLYLFLAIICFIGVIAIIIFGGYLGVFDTLTIATGGNELTLDTDALRVPEPTPYYPYDPARQLTQGGKTDFSYEMENRRFSPYVTRLDVTIWSQNQPGPISVVSRDINIGPFSRTTVDWSIGSDVLDAYGFQSGFYMMRISREGAERRIQLDYIVPVKPVPVVPPQ